MTNFYLWCSNYGPHKSVLPCGMKHFHFIDSTEVNAKSINQKCAHTHTHTHTHRKHHSTVQFWEFYFCHSSGFGHTTSHLTSSLVCILEKTFKNVLSILGSSLEKCLLTLHLLHPVRTCDHGGGGYKLSISMQRETPQWVFARASMEAGRVQTFSDGQQASLWLLQGGGMPHCPTQQQQG